MNPTEKSLDYVFGYRRVLKRFLVFEVFFLVFIVCFLTTGLLSRHVLTMSHVCFQRGRYGIKGCVAEKQMIGLEQCEGRLKTCQSTACLVANTRWGH